MRIVITRDALKWSQRLLFAGGFSLLGYCGYVLIDTLRFQNVEGRQFEQELKVEPQTVTPVSNQAAPPIRSGGLIGRLEIPKLRISVIVIEGTSTATLRRAVGHIAGTAQPGQAGNVGISGHRDTFFRPLRNIERNDIITLTTLSGKYNYRVVSTRVVDPGGISVLDPGEGDSESLTLVTCYPFYFVGPAPGRFIVRAERFI